MDEIQDKLTGSTSKRRPRPGRSMFGPVVLITVGLFLLWDNLGRLPELNWEIALRLWPLLLVFGGLNIMVRQVPRPVGTLLSLIVAIAAVSTFSLILLYPDQLPLLGEWTQESNSGFTAERISMPSEGVNSARIVIETGAAGAEVQALDDSTDLIAGSISYRGRLQFERHVSDGQADVILSQTSDSQSTIWWDPSTWILDSGSRRWDIGLSKSVDLDLTFDLGSGHVDLSLLDLSLVDLAVNAGSGRLDVRLPVGNYDASFNLGSGQTSIGLPSGGLQELRVDSGSGALRVLVPERVEARIIVIDGQRRLKVDDDRFDQVEFGEGRAVWETDAFEEAGDGVLLILDIGSGQVAVIAQ